MISCSKNLKNAKTEILFEQIETHWQSPTDSSRDTLASSLENYDLEGLDSTYQKAFWYNAYNFLLEESSHNSSGYLDMKQFMKRELIIAKQNFTTGSLIKKIQSFNDPRPLICLDFYTTTSSPTYHYTLKRDGNEDLDSLCNKIINDKSFVRVKKDIKSVYYPEHFDWHLNKLDSTTTSKNIILRYHDMKNELTDYKFIPYPFSYKLRN